MKKFKRSLATCVVVAQLATTLVYAQNKLPEPVREHIENQRVQITKDGDALIGLLSPLLDLLAYAAKQTLSTSVGKTLTDRTAAERSKPAKAPGPSNEAQTK